MNIVDVATAAVNLTLYDCDKPRSVHTMEPGYRWFYHTALDILIT